MSSTEPSSFGAVVAVISVAIIAVKVGIVIEICRRRSRARSSTVNPADTRFDKLAVDIFLEDMEREKPIRFTSQQLRIATDNFSILLGSGGFGAVYKGIFSNGTTVAVKILSGSSAKRIEEQFMAEVSTIGRIHHFNLVRLYGFCFERNLRALVYEYMANGSLDKFLFHQNKELDFHKLNAIAVGTAKGIAYLHEECLQRIIHYDIKPGNILLDANFNPKVSDFGLARLCNRDNSHISMTGGRGTPGYAAPELWIPYPVTHKVDVYSFGMLLFEIIGRRRNLDISLPESQEWFPRWVWKKFENGEIRELMKVCGCDDGDNWKLERTAKVALWCVQYRPEMRPLMSIVVKMLEGSVDIPVPLNPFEHLMVGIHGFGQTAGTPTWNNNHSSSGFDSSSPALPTATPIMRKYEIELASV